MNVEYFVAAQAMEQDGKKYATIEIIDESTSRPCEQPPDTRVRINPAGKMRALARLMGTPLMGPPELGHAAERAVGSAVDWSSNGATKVLYEIADRSDWERMRSGEWGPVSPKMTPTAAHFEEDGTYVLDEWSWDNVAFVPKGAYPNAGVKSTCIGDPRLCGFPGSGAVAAADGGARFDSMRPTVGDLVGYPLGEYPQPEPRFFSFSEAVAAALTQNSTGRFDPMKPTVGDLVGRPLPSTGLSGTRGGASGVVVALHPRGIKEVSR